MSNITVHKENGNRPATLAHIDPRREPFRLMREMLGWDPFGEMTPFFAQGPTGFAPAFEIKETKDGYTFKADVPGVKSSDVDITVTGNRLTVAGKRESEKMESTDTYYTYERSFGDFTRSFTLPDGVDMNTVSADLRDGVLTLNLKKAPGAQTKKIAVQSGTKTS